MNIANVLAITFLIIGLLAVFNCFWLLFASLFPNFNRQAQKNFSAPFKTFFVGVGAGLIPGILSASLLGNPVGRILGWPVFVIVVAASIAGTAALAHRIGNGMPSQNDRVNPWRKTLRGGVVLSITFLMPFLGWFVWFPIALTLGFGITFLTVLQLRKARKVAAREALAATKEAADGMSVVQELEKESVA
jgi:hypothetical protein